MKCIQILCISLLLLGQISAQVRRNAMRSTGFFAKPRTSSSRRFTSSRDTQFRTSTKNFQCPILQKNKSRSLTTETFISKPQSFQKNRFFDFVKKNPGKTVGIVSGIGATALTRYELKKHSEKTSTQYEVNKLAWFTGGYHEGNLSNVLNYIEELAQKDLINEHNRQGDTPLMIIMKGHLINDAHKAIMLNLLFKHGAQFGKDQQKAVNLALGLNENAQDLYDKKHILKPQFATLKAILPHVDQEIIETLITFRDDKIKELQIGLESAQNNLEELQKEKGLFGFTFNRDKQIDEKKLSGHVSSYQNRLNQLLKLKNIAQKSLKKYEAFQKISTKKHYEPSYTSPTRSNNDLETPNSIWQQKEQELIID